jgi:hypothetical protein
MRRYGDLVDVRRGMVGGIEAPEQFVWRQRLWVVCAVIGQWVETGTWWEQAPVRSLLGTEPDPSADGPRSCELLAEREMWRVEAARGRSAYSASWSAGWCGVFDLAFAWQEGQWRLVHALD